jgi:hypothetical protein
MGWRDRDWARLNDDEWRDIYGITPDDRAGVGAPARGVHRRVAVWAMVGVLVAATLIFAGLASPSGGSGADEPTPAVIYGLTGSQAGNVPAIGGHPSVCTEVGIASSGAWTCLGWTNNLHDVPVVEPHEYGGACGIVQADQTRGQWICLRADSPFDGASGTPVA